jgi:hypothetical protein
MASFVVWPRNERSAALDRCFPDRPGRAPTVPPVAPAPPPARKRRPWCRIDNEKVWTRIFATFFAIEHDWSFSARQRENQKAEGLVWKSFSENSLVTG